MFVRELLEKDASSVDEILIGAVGNGKKELLNLAWLRRDSEDSLTTALYLASRDKNAAEFVEILKKNGAVAPPEVDAATIHPMWASYKNDTVEVTISVNEASWSRRHRTTDHFGVIPIDHDGIQSSLCSWGDPAVQSRGRQSCRYGPSPEDKIRRN